jgi:hypothetical protein
VKSLYRALGGSILTAALLLMVGCNQYIQNPVPVLKSVSPTAVQAGGATFQITVSGKDFVFGGNILWNGSLLSTLFVSSNEMQATINPQLFTQPGPITIQVFNPAPGGGDSNSVTLTINPGPSPIPTVSSIQPTAAQVGGLGFTLTVNGSNFTPTSVVNWNGANIPASYVDSSQITASIPATDVQDPGTVQVAVLNSKPGGGLSNSMPFEVNNVTPAISSISPTTTIAGSAGFTLIVKGAGFACEDLTTTTTTTNGTTTTTTSCPQSASEIQWNGAQLSTTYDVTDAELIANVSTAQLTQAGTAFVTIFNPAPGGGTSPAAYFQVIPGANGEGLPALIDVSSNGAQADAGIGNLGNSGPVIAGGGRFIAFSSVSQNLVANLANAVANVFLRDTCLGISSGCSPQTILISQANDGVPTNADAIQPSISSDGRYVAFSSKATNLISGATTGSSEIYLRDTCLGAPSGCSPSTALISVAPDGAMPANGSSTQPYISADGQYIAFVSTATNLVSNATTGAPEIYLRNTCLNVSTSCTPTTVLVSVATDGSTPADGTSATPVVASGGRYVAFQSTATNLVSIPSSATQQLYWRDTCIGATGCTPSTSLVSIGADGSSPGNGPSSGPSMSSDGRYVAFSSQATNLIGAGFVSGTPQQIYERDMCAGASSCTPSTTLVSVASDGSSPANAPAEDPQSDQTGRYVLFASAATNLTSSSNSFEQIYARDTCLGASGCTPKTVLISLASGGALGDGNSLYPAITSQAHFAAFLSFANNIVSDDTTPNFEDIFLAVTTF